MSRTIRFRKEGQYVPWWNDYDHRKWVFIGDNEEIDPAWEIRLHHSWRWSRQGVRWERKLTGMDAKKVWWKSHKDDQFNFKEPGPSWWRNLYTTRPLRRDSKNELRKFMSDPNYEPIVDRKGKLEYWT